MIKFFGLIILCSSYFAEEALAEPLDCDKISHSQVPYELTTKSDDKNIISQNYRNDRFFISIFSRQADGKTIKSLNQGPFLKTQKFQEGVEIKFDYWYLDTSRPFADSMPKFYDILPTRTQNGNSEKLPSYRHYLEYKGIEALEVGPCVFQSVHYVDTEQSFDYKGSTKAVYEKWYSPALNKVIKFTTTLMKTDGTVARIFKGEAISIATNFETIKFP